MPLVLPTLKGFEPLERVPVDQVPLAGEVEDCLHRAHDSVQGLHRRTLRPQGGEVVLHVHEADDRDLAGAELREQMQAQDTRVDPESASPAVPQLALRQEHVGDLGEGLSILLRDVGLGRDLDLQPPSSASASVRVPLKVVHSLRWVAGL